MSAHEAAVDAIAAALCIDAIDAGNGATGYYRRQARVALAALVRSEAVRNALHEELKHAEGWPADVFLAALAPPEATDG